MSANFPSDPRVEQILEVLAREVRVPRKRLEPNVRADELGASPFEIAMALLELEDRFDIDPLVQPPDAAVPTVKELVLQVLDFMDRRHAALR